MRCPKHIALLHRHALRDQNTFLVGLFPIKGKNRSDNFQRFLRQYYALSAGQYCLQVLPFCMYYLLDLLLWCSCSKENAVQKRRFADGNCRYSNKSHRQCTPY